MTRRLMVLMLITALVLPLPGTGCLAEGGSAEYTLEKEDGCRQLTLYWSDPDADYDTCDVWIWFPGRDGSGNLFHP